MLHPLLHLFATNPHLLGEHVEAYADLVSAEVGSATKRWKARVALYGMAVFLLMVGTVLAGVALMLWAVMPTINMQAPWLLLVVPLIPLLVSGLCIFRARSEPEQPAFNTLRNQVSADLAMLREVSAS